MFFIKSNGWKIANEIKKKLENKALSFGENVIVKEKLRKSIQSGVTRWKLKINHGKSIINHNIKSDKENLNENFKWKKYILKQEKIQFI